MHAKQIHPRQARFSRAGLFGWFALVIACVLCFGASGLAQPSHSPLQVPLSPPPPMRYVPGLAEPLVATGPVTEQESKELDAALTAFREAPAKAAVNADFDDYARPLLAFLAAHPRSHWNAALYLDVALGYYQSGYYSRTFEYFKKSWTLGRNADSIEGKRMADRAMGELAEMYARLGRARELKAFFAGIGDRPVSGPAMFMMQGAHDGLASFEHRPDVSYLCGPAALRNMLLWLKAKPEQIKVADDARSGRHGVSLAELGALAQKAGLQYQLIYRRPGQALPAPSIINWSVHHYAAILEMRDGRYRLQDPTFGNAGSVVTIKAADAEGSGYFLVPEKVMASHPHSGWRLVVANSPEAKSVYGMGNTFNFLPFACQKCGDFTTNAPNSGHGMTLASAKTATAALSLSDTPVGYSPQKGPASFVTLTYNARDGDHPANFGFSNVSPQWTHSWQSYIQDDPKNPGSSVKRVAGGGGGYDYDILAQLAQNVYTATTGAFVPEIYDNAQLVRIPATGPAVSYVRNLPNGGKEAYGLSNGAATYPRIMFLTSVADPAGNVTTLNYDGTFRLTSIKDAVGRSTTFTYGIAGRPFLITRITDPFGRSSQLTYDTSERLASITDPIGIVSSFTYGNASEPNFITQLATPYGVSKFSDKVNPNDANPYGTVRLSLTMTDPLNNVEYLTLYQNQGLTGSGPEAVAPTGMTNDNPYLMWRNTYYWNAHEAAQGNVTTDASGNPVAEKWATADIYHWFHQCCTINYVSNQLGSVKRPLEKYRQWDNVNPIYNTGYYSGTLMKPTATGRVLDDGTTQLAQASYNGFGNPLSLTDPVGRSTQYTYAANNIDLLTVKQLTASPSTYTAVATFGNYNNQHEPQSVTGPDGKAWIIAYNAAGQRTSLTDPDGNRTSFKYDASSRLSTITDANGATVETLAYDAADRIASRTDSEGYKLTYAYDNLDRVTKITYPNATSDSYDYTFQSGPNAGKPSLDLRKHSDRLGRVTTFDYDADRRLISKTEPLAGSTTRTTHYAYYEDGTLKDIIDADGADTHWAIDLESRPVAKTYVYGSSTAKTETYQYEATTSRLHSVTDALGQVKTFTYDHNDDVIALAYTHTINPTPNVSFSWDPYFARLSSMTDGTGTTRYTYVPPGANGALQIAGIAGSFANDTIAFAYDALGRLAARTIPGGNESFGYDAVSRLISHTSPLGVFTDKYLGETDQPVLRSVTNTAARSTTQTVRRVQSVGSATPSVTGPATTVSTTWSYDTNANDRRLIGIGNSGVTRSFTLGYGSGGTVNPYDVLSMIDTAAKGHPFASATHNYAYDLSDRLVTANSPGLGNDAYGYDPLDNITRFTSGSGTISASYNNLNQLTAWGGTMRTYDANGNTLSDGANTYKWDAENRLIEIDYAGGTKKTMFAYDGSGRRRVEAESSGGASVTTRYLWCGSAVCQTRNGSDVVLRRDLTEGEVNVTTGQKLVYMPDQLGSVRDVLDASTGARVASYDYAPYGAVVRSAATTGTDYQYAGLFFHPASGDYLSTYRPFDESRGRWLDRDPIKELGGTNLYTYANGMPIAGNDPRGLVLFTENQGYILSTIGELIERMEPINQEGQWLNVLSWFNSGSFKYYKDAFYGNQSFSNSAVSTAKGLAKGLAGASSALSLLEAVNAVDKYLSCPTATNYVGLISGSVGLSGFLYGNPTLSLYTFSFESGMKLGEVTGWNNALGATYVLISTGGDWNLTEQIIGDSL
jgi:RHS repeat-associated protein